ncbi:uncharacterized protein LOC141613882 isoform X2 [Silene latifolia]|uniref:uncharacterized protein LOC141613882 isoform X2 n=1 Tax=Silene latifolia TaxID=37657 RepID=UPI003D76D1C3
MIILFEGPVKTLVVDRIVQYLKFIKSYEDNMNVLVEKLEILCAKKLDLDAKVIESKQNMEVMTRETANWLKSLYRLIEREEMKELMREDKVAEITVKMMNQRVMKKFFKEDREIFDILVHVVKKKCNLQADDAEEDADYKKVAKIAREVMKDISEEFKKFIKTDDAAVAAVNLLNYNDLEKLKKDDEEMAKILIKAEGINRWEVEHHDDGDVQPVDKINIVNEKVGFWRKHMGSLMAFLDDENFKKDLPDGVKIGLEVMDAFNKSSKSTGSEEVEANDKSHRYCGCCVVRFKVYSHRHDMSVIAEIMVEAIKSMILECPLDHVTRSIRDDELEIIPSEFIGGLDSREILLQKILKVLQDDQVNIVGVFGMGGSGKTLLAKEVANKRASDLFDKRVVVEVSEAPNIKGIQSQIAGEIGLILDDMHTVARRARILYNKLKSEKILIILDNVWKKLKLDEVGIPCESTKDFCCKLLITTREKQVCRVMDVQNANIFEVGMLNERDALNLFENKNGKKVGSGEFKPVVDRLLTKCAGLPLAIVTTASALRGKHLEMWCQFAATSEKPISSQVSNEYREIYSILETSYKLMDSEEKKLFFFLVCLSPLDSAVTVEDLMRYGIGLDLFQRVNDLSEAMEQANMWINELTSSSLLLKGDSDGEVKIHDLVRASAISFIDKGKDRMTLVERIPRWMCRDTFEKFTAISLMSGHDYSRLCGVKAPMLEILLLKGDASITTLNSDFFGGMKNLKVLSLSNMNFNLGLPKTMGELKRLQTLHLHHCKLKDIKLVGKLVSLLVLSLRESSLEELAVEIGDLCNLRLLDIGGCKGVKRIPANILSRLSHLEGLYMHNVFDRWAVTNAEVNDGGDYKPASGSELDTLSHLNVLEMDVCRAGQLLTVNNSQQAEQLKKFKIRVNSHGIYEEVVPALNYVLELMDINGSPSNWLRALLKKSECLILSASKRHSENVVPQLDEDGFKDLKYLIVSRCQVRNLISSNEEDESIAFMSLEVLWLEHMNNFAMICDGKAPVGIFSNLRRLKLISLSYLKCGLPLTSGSLNLCEVSIIECGSLEFIAYTDGSIATNETNDDLLPCLKSLQLSYVTSLSSLVEQSLNEVVSLFNAESKYPSLESLELSLNYRIVTLWSPACYVSSFQGLKVLYIDQCSELRSLGSPSIFAALVKLEELRISECEKLREVISNEIEEDGVREHVISFPLLKHLSLERLRAIESFYRGSYKLEFPNLKSLCLSVAESLTNFDGSKNSIAFFSDKIEFPCLEEMDVQYVSNEVARLWNWSSSGVQGQRESSSSSVNPVPNLQNLTLGQVHGLTSIPPYISHKLSHLQVYYFNDIRSLFSVSAVNKEVLWTYSQLPNLENLSVGSCESLEQLFDNKDDDVAISLCQRLRAITLDTLHKLKMFPLHLIKNVRTLSITKLSWKYVFSADLFIKGREQLQQLENLEITKCYRMEVIIMDELVGDGEDRVFNFPRLKSLMLDCVTMTNFVSKINSGLQFPLLESMKLKDCSSIRSFCSGPFTAPKLKELELNLCYFMKCFLPGKMNEVQEFPSLESVTISGCPHMLSFSSAPVVATKLHQVTLMYCGEMKWFLPGDPDQDNILILPCLESVSIGGCGAMKSFSSGGINFPNLCELKVNSKDYSKCANEELHHLLVNLPKWELR